MNFELFDPNKACNALLPLNPIANTVSYYRIVGLDYTLNDINVEHSEVKNGKVRLGLPLGLIFPSSKIFDTKTYVSSSKFSLEYGKEGVFYPINKTAKPKFIDIYLTSSDIKNKTYKGPEGTFKLSELTMDSIQKNGFAIQDENTSILYIRPVPSKLFVKNDQIKTGKFEFAGNVWDLSSNQITTLKNNGRLELKKAGATINLEFLNDNLTKSSNNTNGAAVPINITPMTITECKTFARSIYPSTKMNNDEYEEFLGELYLSKDLGKTNNERLGISSNNIELKRFFAGLPYFTRPTGNLDWDLWYPFDLRTLISALSREGRYAKFISERLTSEENDFQLNTPNRAIRIKGFKLPNYEIGIYTSYSQEWNLVGYSRGSLLSSLTLAPKEELSIEILTYDKHKITNENSLTTEVEINSELSVMAKASTKVTNEIIDTTDAKAEFGLGIPVPAGNIPVKIDSKGTLNKNIKDTLSLSAEKISELTQKATEKIKSTNQVKIVQSREFGEEKKVIRKLSNPNNSRTLTFNHFEILENYQVNTKYNGNLQTCLLVENPYYKTAIDLNFILAYQDKLAASLLNKTYAAGLDAALKLSAQRWYENKKATDLILSKLAEENSDDTTGSSTDVIEKNIIRYAIDLKTLLVRFLSVDIQKATMILFNELSGSGDNRPTDEEVEYAEMSFGLASFWMKFRMVYPTIESKARTFVSQLPDNPSEAIALTEVEKFVNGLDDEWLSSLKLVAVDIVAGLILGMLVGPQAALAAAAIAPLMGQLLVDKSEGLPSLIGKCKTEVSNYQKLNSVVSVAADLEDSSSKFPEQDIFTLNELAAAYAEFEKLVLHIEVNKAYYTNRIWQLEDSEVRYSRLKLQGLDKFIENKILGFVGHKAAFELKLDNLPKDYQEYIETNVLNPKQSANSKDLFTNNLTLPTSGVYMESLLGKCEALEPMVMQRIELELEMSKIQNEIAKQRLEQLKLENEQLKKSIP